MMALAQGLDEGEMQTPVAMNNGNSQVFVAAVPLRATKGPAQLLMSTAYYSLNFQHFMVLLKTPNHHQIVVYDFQPEDPENIMVAAAALSGQKVPGVVLMRKMRKLPTRKCWFVGYSKENAMDEALNFNQNWNTDLRIGHHDCRNYCQGLVECLTDQKVVLEHF